MRKGAFILFAAAAAAAALLPGRADAALTATQIRIGDHPAFVRVVVDFSGGNLSSPNTLATDPEPFADGRARIRVHKAGIQSTAAARRAFGVRARIVEGTNTLALRLRAPRHRFKYLGYSLLASPERLVVDLWKAAPPSPAAEVPIGAGGCLTLDSWRVRRGRAAASGHEHDLFEHMFAITLRNARGAVVGTRGVTASNGAWHRRLRYAVRHRQAGTLEVVDFSAKDGALDCLAQVRVTLRRPRI